VVSELVETCWGIKEISTSSYWHLASNDWNYTAIFKNNVRVGKGALLSVSAGIAAEPGIINAQTPYSLRNINNDKERIFEEIRLEHYPNLPSRLKSLYIFDSYSLVEKSLIEWFPNQQKIIHECRVLNDAIVHKADTVWLNTLSHQWSDAAHKYWSGEASTSYFPETLVQGAIYFPDWEQWAND
jgi:hypothetical protein